MIFQQAPLIIIDYLFIIPSRDLSLFGRGSRRVCKKKPITSEIFIPWSGQVSSHLTSYCTGQPPRKGLCQLPWPVELDRFLSTLHDIEKRHFPEMVQETTNSRHHWLLVISPLLLDSLTPFEAQRICPIINQLEMDLSRNYPSFPASLLNLCCRPAT
jgi:hypothetical protein